VQVHGEPRLAKILPPAESVINLSTAADLKPKSIVVLSSSQIDGKEIDLNCTYPKKVVLRDLIQVMREEKQLRGKPLVYNLMI
jgi:hypothetical protein